LEGAIAAYTHNYHLSINDTGVLISP